MTSNLAGIEPPLPTCNRSFPLPPSRTASHDLQQTPRSWPRHAVNPTPNAPASSQDASEPAFKRQKIGDPATHLIGRTTGTLRSVLDISNATSNKCEFLIDGADFSPERESEGKEQQPSLFPGRPSKIPKSGGNQQGRALAIERATARDVVPIKPHVPEPPSSAPRFHKAGNCHLALCEAMYTYSQTLGPADFFPWTGRHAEDVLNELTTKQGFYDKSPISQNESNTARPSVWSSLKHKSGLQILSSLFVSALDQRQTHGTITTNSTFKPPPRVTLTDTKREAWLRDLANPSIPLRRLSRTIPHGIRGKILLDHCLSKDIPTSRAIWLAKCVGANEIRAFKRKGTGGVFTVGGEGKWIKDWTTNVEQFLESILGFCGSTEWRSKINYGLRLITHLYSEHLLDQDHYLDWLIASFRDGDLDALPVWLLVMQIHHPDILQHRQRGRRLAEAILKHLDKHLSVGKYLQWLIARGTLDGHHEPSSDGPCDVYLLFELPLQGLPSYVLSLRSMLLATLGVPAERESDMIIAVKERIVGQIPDFFLWDALSGSGAGCAEFALLSQTVKSAVALWIRQNLFSRLQVYRETESGFEDAKRPTADPDKFAACLLTLEQFHTIRRILEDFEDFAILADVLYILSDEVLGSILTAVTDTVNHYFDVINAIGAADDIFRRLYHQVEKSHGPEFIERAFLESLIDLACRLPNTAQEIQRLRNDTLAFVPRLSAVAFSPISDNMVEAVQPTEPTFPDDMDQMLASGTSMDKQTLTRVFCTIIGHLETLFEESSQLRTQFSQLLSRLRRFGPKTFDALLKDWLQRWLPSDFQAKPGIVLSPMICSKVVSLKVVLDTTARLLSLEGHRNYRATLALKMLDMVFWGILQQEQLGESSPLDRHSRILRLMNSTSNFNVPLVLLELRAILSGTGSLEDAKDTLADIFVERASASRDGRVELWARLVSELPVSQAVSIREKAETQIICLGITNATSMCHVDKTRLDGLSAIIEAAGFSVSDAENSSFLDQIADGLSMICSSPQLDKNQFDHDEIDSDRVCQFIDVFISLLIIHQSTIQHPRFSQSALFQILVSLSRLLIHPFLASHPTLPSNLFDTLTILSDSLSEDTRTRCIRTLRDHHHSQDPRLRFIFGYPETVDSEWLQLATRSSTFAEVKCEGVTIQPYSLRRWEMMQDATPISTENDTSLSLTLFGARKSVIA
ncbi:MAG: RNA polymerase II mediator complex subunit [Alectoria sarmentosa]|nr:MAG: RNA polymerase II mediator complex subunit [Alectoria sarmentosa]